MGTQFKEYSRTDILAQPRRFHPDFKEQRRSVYWIDKAPFAPGPNGTTQIVASRRVCELANPRSVSANYRYNRPTPAWKVKKSALQREPTDRIIFLSVPRRPVAVPDRSVYSSVPEGAPRQKTLDHLMVLSQPKVREDKFGIQESHWGEPDPVPFSALTANPTSRLEDLARPKQYHQDFQGERPVQTEIPEHALTSIANQTLKKLALPRARTMIVDEYDPYKVSNAAQHTKPTARTDMLATPIMRKQRQKKIV